MTETGTGSGLLGETIGVFVSDTVHVRPVAIANQIDATSEDDEDQHEDDKAT